MITGDVKTRLRIIFVNYQKTPVEPEYREDCSGA
jgi:hypothetical protein